MKKISPKIHSSIHGWIPIKKNRIAGRQKFKTVSNTISLISPYLTTEAYSSVWLRYFQPVCPTDIASAFFAMQMQLRVTNPKGTWAKGQPGSYPGRLPKVCIKCSVLLERTEARVCCKLVRYDCQGKKNWRSRMAASVLVPIVKLSLADLETWLWYLTLHRIKGKCCGVIVLLHIIFRG